MPSGAQEGMVRTGNDQLDYILGGGLMPHAFYVVEGDPGAGKTTLALQFIMEGVRTGQKALYLTLSETEADLRLIAQSHKMTLDKVAVHEMWPTAPTNAAQQGSVMYHPAEVELAEVTQRIFEVVEKEMPDRVVIDSLSEVRYLSQTSLRYQRQLIALKSFFHGRHCTVLLLDDRVETPDFQLHSSARGTITLEKRSPNYGVMRRRLQVSKMRGRRVRTGYHDFIIETGGLTIFPRLIAREHETNFKQEALSSGVPELDAMLGGGVQRGTSTLIMGSAGTGKSTIAAQYAVSTAEQGEKAAVYIFDETAHNFFLRCEGMQMPFDKHRKAGRIDLTQVDPTSMLPGEFAWRLRRAVEEDDVKLIVIDSLNGFFEAMPDEQYLKGQLHELLSYLSQRGVTTLLIFSQRGLVGPDVESTLETSYLADSIVLLRYFEFAGKVRKAISIVKKRTGGHETNVRELAFDSKGVRIGQPLTEFSGVLAGELQYQGGDSSLLPPRPPGSNA